MGFPLKLPVNLWKTRKQLNGGAEAEVQSNSATILQRDKIRNWQKINPKQPQKSLALLISDSRPGMFWNVSWNSSIQTAAISSGAENVLNLNLL